MTSEPEAVETERVNESTGEIEEVGSPAPMQIFASSPQKTLEQMSELVQMMDEMTHKAGREKYVVKIQGKDYPLVTWWTTIALPLQLMPIVRWTKRIDAEPNSGFDHETWQSRVEVVHVPTGNVVSAGEGVCSAVEGGMFVKSSACSAMSQTRAIGRAFRGPLAGLAVFAGINATPAEEMYEDSKELKEEIAAIKAEADEVFGGDEADDEYAELAKTKFTFGKHKGKTFAEVRADKESKSYFKWFAENAQPDSGSKWYDKNLAFYDKVVRFRALARERETE